MEEESKAKRMCCHERPAREEEDMISKLPDALISHILSYLSTKEAVKTSVLSHRWLTLWLLISELDLNSHEFPEYNAFSGFVDRFLVYCREDKSCLHKLTLKILKRKNDKPSLTRWIAFLSKRKQLKHLDVEYHYVSRKRLEAIPVSLYVCETLLYLRLNRVLVGKFDSVSLPCLKTLRLEKNTYASGATGPELLISSCPVLEDLSLAKLQMVSNVFKSISTARDLFISQLTMEIISCYFKVEQFPQFWNLSSLEVEVCLRRLDILRMLSTFLESFPTLKSIVLDLTHSKVDTLPIALSSVPPQCLLSSLESVEIKSRYEAEFVLMELAKCFAENSVILKKLVVSWERSKLQEDTVLSDLLALQWRSSMCQIEVRGPLKRLVV